MISTTPPMAWLPHRVDWEPRRISMREISPVSRLAKSKPPEGWVGSFSCTPSISTRVWSESAPRMKIEVGWPSPPVRDMVIPGVRASRSATWVAWLAWMAAASSTVTELPTLLSGSGVRLATTTTSSTGFG